MDKLAARRARTNMHKVAGATEIVAALKRKGISVKKNELGAIQEVLQKANEKNMANDKELAVRTIGLPCWLLAAGCWLRLAATTCCLEVLKRLTVVFAGCLRESRC